MSNKIDINNLDLYITQLMEEYGDQIYLVTDEALSAGEKVLIENLKAASPEIKNPPKGYIKKNYKKNWKGTGKKYKLHRYVGNSTTVKSKKGGKEIPLSNILEYSTTKGKPFIKTTYEASVSQIANAIINEIKRGV